MPEKILIIDDEPEALKLFGYALHRQGYEVIPALNGKEGLDLLQRRSPDLLIVDVMMPGMDGYEVVRRVRANPETRHLPIILLTARSETKDKVTGFEVGTDDYITKPVPFPELFARIKSLLARATYITPTQRIDTRVVAFLGSKGGVGTTTLVCNVGTILSRQGRSVVLADLSSYPGALLQMLKLAGSDKSEPASDMEASRITSKWIRSQVMSHFSGTSIFTTASFVDAGRLSGAPDKVDAIVSGLLGISQFLLLDLGNGLTPGISAALHYCQRTIVVSEMCPLSLVGARSLMRSLSTLGLTGNQIDVVVNGRSRSSVTLSQTDMGELLERELLTFIPPAPELCFKSNQQGIPIAIVQPENPSVESISEIARSIAE